MSLGEIRLRLALIREAAKAGDEKRATWMETDLLRDVLAAIADGALRPHMLARGMLAVDRIKFRQWAP